MRVNITLCLLRNRPSINVVPSQHLLLLNSGVHLCPLTQNSDKLIAKSKCKLYESYRISGSENDAEEAFKFCAKPLTKDLAIFDLKEKKDEGDNIADTQKGMV